MPNARAQFGLQSLLVLTICTFLFGMGQFHRAAGAIVAPVWQEQFVLNADQLGVVIAVIFVVNIVAQGFVGTLLDSVGPRKIISLFLLILAVGTVGCIWAGGYATLILARIVMGLGLTVGGVGMYMLLARNFPPDQFGFLNGLMVTLGGIGGLAATYPLAFTIERFGWEATFAGLALFTALFAGAIFLTAQKDPAEDKTGASVTFLALLRNRRLLPLLIMGFVTWAPITCITGLWGGPYFKDVHGLTLEETGLFQALFFCATMASGTAFGLMDKWLPVSRFAVILTAALISVASLAGLAVLGEIGYGTAVVLLLVMIFAQQFYVPLIAQLRDTVPEAAIGRATSLYTIIAVAAIPSFQTLFGLVIEWGGDAPEEVKYRTAFATMAGIILVLTLMYAVLERRATRAG